MKDLPFVHKPWDGGGHFKIAHELLNLRALKFLTVNKIHIFHNLWIRYFVRNFKGYLWNSPQIIIPIHWKIRLLYNVEILRALRFKSSYIFWNAPPASPPWAHIIHQCHHLGQNNVAMQFSITIYRDRFIFQIFIKWNFLRLLYKYLEYLWMLLSLGYPVIINCEIIKRHADVYQF